MAEDGIPLREWVNDGVDYLQTEYAAPLRKISENVAAFVKGMENFLLDPNPVVITLLALLTVLLTGWFSGHFGNLARRYERGERRGSTLLAIGMYTGAAVFTGAVLALNLVLHVLLDLGVDLAGLTEGLAPWFVAEAFTFLGVLALAGAVNALRDADALGALVEGAGSRRVLPALGGTALTLLLSYGLVFALWTLLKNPSVGPVWVMAGLFVIIAAFTGGWPLALFAALGLALIENIQYWSPAMQTLALVLCSGIVCVAIGLPLGIAMSRSERVAAGVKPALDFMQTMPALVYLIPGIAFFGIGAVPALVATVVFALPPVVRLTAHGIQEVEAEVVEASDSFGATRWQTLVKAQLPLARPSIMVGVNQTLLLSLSMVVIASFVGAAGLGNGVVSGLERVDPGLGFEAGLSVVILAVLIDRVTQAAGATRSPGESSIPFGWVWDSLRRWFRTTTTSQTPPDISAAKK